MLILTRGMNRFLVSTLAALSVACSGTGTSAQPESATPRSAEVNEEPSGSASDAPVAAERGAPSGPSDSAPGEGAEATSEVLDWTPWAEILAAYVTDDGGFRYEALRANEAHTEALRALVDAVSSAEVEAASRDAKLAFYINAYNILVVHTVLERWPLESVLSSEGFFDGVEYPVVGTARTLNGLENDVIRDREVFGEPRIHFAVNCASAGCPPLANQPYTAATLEAMLARQTRAYVRGTSRLDRGASRVRVSQIFEWFAEDFGGPDGVRRFLAAHLEAPDASFVSDSRTTVGHFDYDWALNARD